MTSGIVVKCTTTDRARAVSITTAAAQALAERRAEMQKAATAAGLDLSRDGFVFSSDLQGSRPVAPSVITRGWARVRAHAGIGDVRIHDLRHFVATELLSAGIDARTVSNRLGHARTSTTFDIYWAWVPPRDREAADTSTDC